MNLALPGISARLHSLPTRTMSWDVFLFTEDPRPYPKGTSPPPVGTDAGVRAILAAAFPELEWPHDSIARCEASDGYLNLSFHEEEGGVKFILAEVHGGEGTLAELVRFCRAHGWVAWQSDNLPLLNLDSPLTPAWQAYQAGRAQTRDNPLDFCGQKWRPSRPGELLLFLNPGTESRELIYYTVQWQFAPLWLEAEDYHSQHRTFVVDVEGSFRGLSDYRQLDGMVDEHREAISSEKMIVQHEHFPPDLSLWSMGPGGIHHHAVDGWDGRLTLGQWREDFDLDCTIESFFPGPQAKAANEELRGLERAYEDIADDDPRWAVIEQGWQFRYSSVISLARIFVTVPVNAPDPIGWAKRHTQHRLKLDDFGFCKVNAGGYDGKFLPQHGLQRDGRLVILCPATESYHRWMAREQNRKA